MRVFKVALMAGIFFAFFLLPLLPAEEPDTGTLLDTIQELATPIPETLKNEAEAEEYEDFDDFDEETILDFEGPEITIFYNERNEADYIEVKTDEKIEEYHYLSHIKYSDLIFVLSDLLRRITREGYQWARAPAISYEKSDEIVLLYRKDLVNDMVYGIVQFPDFKVWLSAIRQQDREHRYNAGSGRDMLMLVYAFAQCLAQAEQTLGISQVEYTMRFFKPE
ncbi:hypothetical protein [Treponema primitia]|uniref:hypothetical protein n=1 Tax=Treponema primitia TaxID=88058 RepID=UPI0002DFCCCF|nr:hypothetical protein [Treponema primitia]